MASKGTQSTEVYVVIRQIRTCAPELWSTKTVTFNTTQNLGQLRVICAVAGTAGKATRQPRGYLPDSLEAVTKGRNSLLK